ncbi:MAG: aspartate aminotransferase family protein [Deltaproteobacteria bacterium]|nr:aspartate aminotransferase family protein [Deltaproteobacteria bacterium]
MSIGKKKSEAEVKAGLDAGLAAGLDWKSGRVFAYAYDPGEDVRRVAQNAYAQFAYENALDPTVFPGLLQFEREIGAKLLNHLNAPENAGAIYTSGGTESCMLGVRSALRCAQEKRPRLTAPELVLSNTTHPAFHKAANYFGIKVVIVDVDAKTAAPTAEAIAAAINERTVAVIASAPSYAHGVIDPVEAIAKVCREKDIWLHVDACVGGMLLPYYRELGRPIPAFDFSVPGVESISIDLHKYGYTPKGVSFILHRDRNNQRFQRFTHTDWTGYTFVNQAMQSSRLGGPLAAAWAVLNYVGDEGYLDISRRMIADTDRLIAGIKAVDGLDIFGDPQFSMVAFYTTDGTDALVVADEMSMRGFQLQGQIGNRGLPSTVHVSLHQGNGRQIDAFIQALNESMAAARIHCASQTGGASELINDELIEHLATAEDPTPVIEGLFTAVGLGDGKLPERTAAIFNLLDRFPAQIRNRILSDFAGKIYDPSTAR